jgi:hypothetical protein
VTASGLGSVLRDVKAGGCCYVPISSAANTHRATVQSRQKSPEATTRTKGLRTFRALTAVFIPGA